MLNRMKVTHFLRMSLFERKAAAVVSLVGIFAAGNWLLQAQTTTPAAGTSNPLKATEQNLAAAYKLFQENCATCHGRAGRPGDNTCPLARGVDLTSPHVQSKTDDELFQTISAGVPKTVMPPFGTSLGATERWQLVLLLRRLPKLTEAERAKLEAAGGAKPTGGAAHHHH